MTNQDIWNFLNEKAPFDTAEDWDNPGLAVGSPEQTVHGVVVALDVTDNALQVCRDTGANLLITHHPLLFRPLKVLDSRSLTYRLAAEGICALSAHTNLDKAPGGVNDTLAALLGLTDVRVAPNGLCRTGRLQQPMNSAAFAAVVGKALRTAVRFCGNGTIRTVALCSGGGGEYIPDFAGKADAFVTGEIRHHEWLAAQAAGITAVDAGHYGTEVPVVETLCRWLTGRFPSLPVTACRGSAPYFSLSEDNQTIR